MTSDLFSQKPSNWNEMSEQEKWSWMMGKFKQDQNQTDSNVEMYCLKCKTVFKLVNAHMQREHPGITDQSFIITKETYDANRYALNPDFAKQMAQMLWFWGIDPARERDYHTIVIHGLPSKRTTPWLPRIKDLYRVKKVDYVINLNFIIKELYPKYPFTLAHVDSTRDPTFAEILTRKFGHKMVPLKFQNVGNQNTKFDLKLIGKGYLDQGYTLPDVDNLLRAGKISPDKAFLVKELKIEALREITKLTNTDRITFDQTKHNDLVHGWEMSLKGVMEYQKGKIGVSTSAASTIHGASYPMADSSANPREQIEKTLLARFAKRNLGIITDLKINLPVEEP